MKTIIAAAGIVIAVGFVLVFSALNWDSELLVRNAVDTSQGGISRLLTLGPSESSYSHQSDAAAQDPALALLSTNTQNGSVEMTELRRMFPDNLMLPAAKATDTERQKFHDRLDALESREALGISRAETLDLFELRIRKKKDMLEVITYLYDKAEQTLTDAQKEQFQLMIAQHSTALNGYEDKIRTLRTTGE